MSGKWAVVMLLVGFAFASLPGCEDDTDTKDPPDKFVLTVDDGEERTIEEDSSSESIYGYDPVVLSLVQPSVNLSDSVEGTLYAEFLSGYDETGTGYPYYGEEYLLLGVPAEAGEYDLGDELEAFAFYLDVDGGYYSTQSDEAGSGSITITELGEEEDIVEGEFDITLSDFQDPPTSVDLAGTFRVKREVDDFDPACPGAAASGTTHYIETVTDSTAASTDTVIFVYDEDDELVCLADYGGLGSHAAISVQLDSGSTYFIRVTGYDTDDTGPYGVRVSTDGLALAASTGTTSAGDEPDNDDPSGAEEIAVDGDTLDRELADEGDEDWYEFEAE